MTSLERQGACLYERCVTVSKHATGSVGRYDIYRLNETVGARRWYAQRNQSFADGPTPSRFP